jgi:ElaB/YqjD/DUF883 family membrane-anchored ribosome-binding protein
MSEQDSRSSIPSQLPDTEETGIREQAKEYADHAKNTAGKMADQARNNTGEMANQAKERAKVVKDQAADGLERAAQVAHQRASESGGMPAEAGTKVANVMEDTAQYLRTHDSNDIWGDLASSVRRHPIQALAGALVGGFLLGKLFSS